MRIVIILNVLRHRLLVATLLAVTALLAAACGPQSGPGGSGRIQGVGAENEYANVHIADRWTVCRRDGDDEQPQHRPAHLRGQRRVAEEVGRAQLVVQNGVGYDDFMDQIETSATSSSRRVIDVQRVLGLPDSTPNPHLWYEPNTMPAVTCDRAELSALQPAHASYFQHNVQPFDRSLDPVASAIAELAARNAGAPVAITEPVPDYLSRPRGRDDKTPWEFQADVMNGVDLSPQSVTLEENLLRQHGSRRSSTTSRSPTP